MRTWVLKTETKGTGAEMVPIERVTRRAPAPEPVRVPRKPRRRPQPEPSRSRAPRRFSIIDVMTRELLVEDAGTRDALDALQNVRSVVDVQVYVRDEARARWRLLTLAEHRTLWELARSLS